MNNLNSILIEGTLVADPKLSYDATGKVRCNFTLESSRRVKGEADAASSTVTIRLPICTAGRQAEVCREYLKKGRGVRVVGRIDQRIVSPEVAQRNPVEGPMLFIAAEHVEFRPQLQQRKTEHEQAQEL